jgi:hypothetical protein
VRLGSYGSLVLLNPYYYLHCIGLMAVTLAIAYFPSRLPVRRECLEPRAPLLVAALLVLVLGLVVSTLGYLRAVPSSPGRAYLLAAREALAQPVLNTAAPRADFEIFLYHPPFDTAENLLGFAGVDGRWVRTSDDPYMIGPEGARVALAVEGVEFALPDGCRPLDTTIALPTPAGREPNWPTYRMEYEAAADTTARVRVGASVLEVPLVAGAHTVYFTAEGKPSALIIKAPGACVSRLEMGIARPVSPAP